MKARKILGTVLIVLGVLLITLQLISVLGGGMPMIIGASDSALLVYSISSLIGFFLPGLVGVVLCAVGVKLRKTLKQ